MYFPLLQLFFPFPCFFNDESSIDFPNHTWIFFYELNHLTYRCSIKFLDWGLMFHSDTVPHFFHRTKSSWTDASYHQKQQMFHSFSGTSGEMWGTGSDVLVCQLRAISEDNYSFVPSLHLETVVNPGWGDTKRHFFSYNKIPCFDTIGNRKMEKTIFL